MQLIKEDNTIFLSEGSNIEHLKAIPNNTYVIVESPSRGLCLVAQEEFYFPEQIFGDLEDSAKRYVNTFNTLGKSVGVLLTGLKGGGKTLCAKLISKEASLPCLVVNEYFEGTRLLNFLVGIKQEVVVVIDEFDKSYDTEEKQNDMLTILDGVISQRKIFVLTANTQKLNPFLLNRPGRILYYKHFGGAAEETIEEIVNALLKNTEHAEDLINITKALGEVSYDSLIAIIAEMNLYNESPSEVLKHLNVAVESAEYKVHLHVQGKHYTASFYGHPLQEAKYNLYYKTDGQYWGGSEYIIDLNIMSRTYGENGRIDLFNTQSNDTIIFERVHTAKFSL